MKRTINEQLAADEVIDIPPHRRRQFGGATSMLRPSRASVEALVKEIPRGKVATIPLLREVLAKQHKAEVTCPFLTRRALLAIADDGKAAAPFWRVVLATGEMIAAYPGGAAGQAGKLGREGIAVATKATRRKVADLGSYMAALRKS